MTRRLLDVLACPRCRGDLRLGEELDHDAPIEAGTLVCTGCACRYPIERGVPQLLVGQELTRTGRGFSFQWRQRFLNTFERRETLYGHDIDALVRWFFTAAFKQPRFDGWMLDAGSGSGEKAIAAARQHPELQVVAMDIVETLDITAAHSKDAPNLHFVRGDVMHPPFKPHSFQQVVSWGVLHHTPDTRLAFGAVSPLVAQDGSLIVWLYPHPSEDRLMKWYYQTRDWHFLGLGHRLPNRLRLWLVRAYCAVALPLLVYLSRTEYVSRYRGCTYVRLDGIGVKDIYEMSCFLLYDSLTPEFQFRHRREEVLGWLRKDGFVDEATDGLGHYWGRRTILGSSVTSSPPASSSAEG